jgi:hypothetical protein
MAELLFKTSKGHFFAIEPIDHRKEAAAEEKTYQADWLKFMANEAPMPHHAYEGRISYLDPGKEMTTYTRGSYQDGRAVPSKRMTNIMRDCCPLNANDIRNVLEEPRYYIKELYDSRVLEYDEYDELRKWCLAEVGRQNRSWTGPVGTQKITDGIGFPLFFYALHPLFKKFVDGKLEIMRGQYAEGKYSWRMFQDPPDLATAAAAEVGGRVKKRQRQQMQEGIEDVAGLPADYVKLAVTQQHAHEYETIVKTEDERLAKMREAKPADCPTIPNISKRDELYTHQALALAKLQHTNEGVIDIDVGGGKLRILTFDAILCMKAGRCKRPLLVMPNSVIQQQVREIRDFCARIKKSKNGELRKLPKINVFVMNSDTWLKYATDWAREDDDKAYKFYESLSKKMPPNTIFITSYDWLCSFSERREEGTPLCEIEKAYVRNPDGTVELDKDGNPVELKQAATMITRYPRVEWLLDKIGIDYVALDESHKIKNRSTATSKLCLHFNSVPIRRIATGTLTPNEPTDVWAQYAFLDSGMFRTMGDFMATYGQTADKRAKITGWKETAMSEMRGKMLKHGSVSYRKAAWRHLLPKKTERFHKVEMRPAQQAVYKALMLNIIEEIMADPKLRNDWMKFQQDPNSMKDVETKAILAKLVRLDSLMTAMGQDAGTDEIEVIDEETGEPVKVESNRKFIQTLQGEDKISPKVAKIDEILDAHFAEPRNGKVVIFVQNELSTQHLYDYSKYGPNGTKTMGWYMKQPKLRDIKDAHAALTAWENPDDKSIMVLVAVDKSLRTGRNFQRTCNRVIHGDMLWDPGNMEQRQGRIERPRSPFAEVGIYIDWIVTDHSAETCKLAKLISKQALVAQLNAGFETELQWKRITMSPVNMGAIELPEDQDPPPPYVEWDTIAVHRTLPHLLDLHEQKMSQEFRETYGVEMYNRYDPTPLPGSKRVVVMELKGDRKSRARLNLGAEVNENDPTTPPPDDPKGRDKTVDDAKREAARAPKIKIDHKLGKGKKPILEINDPDSIKRLDPEHLKVLGFRSATIRGQQVLYVHRKSHLDLKRIVQSIKDFGYRVDYANSKKVPHIDTIKDPRAPKTEREPTARPFGAKPKEPPFGKRKEEGEDEGEDDIPREEPGQTTRPPKAPDDDTIGLDDLPEEDREPVTLDLALINDEYYYRLKTPKGELGETLGALQFKLERPHWYLPLRSWQHAQYMVKLIKKRGITIDDEEKVLKAIQLRAQAAQLKPKGGYSELDLDKRMPKKKLKGTITLYYAKFDDKPHLGVTDRENILDLSILRSVGFQPADRQYYWRRLQTRTDLLAVLKRMLIAGLKIKNWDSLAATLGRLKVSTEGLEGLKAKESRHASVPPEPPHHKRHRHFRVWA